MFTGEHERLLDDKGRLSLPPTFRRQLVDSAFLTRSTSAPCISVFPEEEIRKVAERLTERVQAGEVSTNRQRLWAASIHEVKTDAQGRMAVPPKLREIAGLDREVVLIGVLNRAEIWDAGAWAALEEDRGDDEIDEGLWL